MTQEMIMLFVCLSGIIGVFMYVLFSKVSNHNDTFDKRTNTWVIATTDSCFQSVNAFEAMHQNTEPIRFKGEHRKYK